MNKYTQEEEDEDDDVAGLFIVKSVSYTHTPIVRQRRKKVAPEDFCAPLTFPLFWIPL